ncbi:protein MAIN-LIKE 1 [Lathyrus oleraceus]|uniref:protein MAIN-LIKE 1 n=1 Tax=Pisum sativum TaxID=3888 RepID=UPI0021D0A046|nr:protein MAIN-LIKE 1-like [Pisum sativum]
MYLLWMKERHRGTHANIEEYTRRNTRFRVHSYTQLKPSPEIIPYLKRAGFSNVAKIGCLNIDSRLVVALLERWRPKTHIFHLPTGECTITLEDVSMLLGLRVNGKAVNGTTQLGNNVYLDNLGIDPPTDKKMGIL